MHSNTYIIAKDVHQWFHSSILRSQCVIPLLLILFFLLLVFVTAGHHYHPWKLNCNGTLVQILISPEMPDCEGINGQWNAKIIKKILNGTPSENLSHVRIKCTLKSTCSSLSLPIRHIVFEHYNFISDPTISSTHLQSIQVHWLTNHLEF